MEILSFILHSFIVQEGDRKEQRKINNSFPVVYNTKNGTFKCLTSSAVTSETCTI